MAWNGSNGKNTNGTSAAKRPVGAAKKSPSVMRGAFAALAVVALAAGAWWWLARPGADFEGDGEQATRHETVATNRVPPRAKVPRPEPVQVVEEDEIPYWEVDASQTNGFTKAMQKKWEHRHRPKYVFDKPERKLRAKYRIFNHRSENEIAALLMATPGASMIGRPNYRGLSEDFMKSCEEPIIVSAEDDEYTRRLKQDMIQAKIEVRQRMADGETLEKIIEDTRAEYRKLSEYKRTLTKEVMDMIRKDAVNEEDIDSFVEAANKMLEDKGIAPMKISQITKKWIINNKGEL